MNGDQTISNIIELKQEGNSYQLQETEFYQIFTQVEDGQINKVCEANGLTGINFSEYFYENIKRFIRSYLKKKGKEEYEKRIETTKRLHVSLLIGYLIRSFFETETKINKQWKVFLCPQFEFLNEENCNEFDAVFLKEISDREKSLQDYFRFAFENNERLVAQYYRDLEKRLKPKIMGRIRFLENHNDIDEITNNTLVDLLIFIREKIKAYKYYYEASTDNYLIYSNVFKSILEKVLKEFYPDNRIPVDFYDEMEDSFIAEEILDPWIINEIWEWIEKNFDEEDIFLLKLYDIYKEHREWRRENFELPDTPILTWNDIAREFNKKFYSDAPQNERVTVNALEMRLINLYRIIKRRVVS